MSRYKYADFGRAQFGYAGSLEAEIAVDLCKHLAIAVAKPDGEDSAGRQKLALLPPSDVAVRACELAEALVGEMTKREWVRPVSHSIDDDVREDARLKQLGLKSQYPEVK